jgi:thiamine-phosphate pyrophosphorylase
MAELSFDRFYPIFDSTEWLEELLPLGIALVQLRIKDRPEPVIRAEIRRAVELCDVNDATLVVNDHWRLAIEEEAPFVHLGQEDLDEADIGQIRAAGLGLGISTHDFGELERALDLQPDYVALGPIYPTVLKAMRFAPQGLERIAEWKGIVGDIPLCAIGGMTVERAAGAFAAGADMVAVVTDITRADDPETRTAQWIEATRLPGPAPSKETR